MSKEYDKMTETLKRIESELLEIRQILQSACDRDWKNENLYQTAVIVSNAMYWRDEEIKNLKTKIEELEDELYRARLGWD